MIQGCLFLPVTIVLVLVLAIFGFFGISSSEIESFPPPDVPPASSGIGEPQMTATSILATANAASPLVVTATPLATFPIVTATSVSQSEDTPTLFPAQMTATSIIATAQATPSD